MQCHIEREIRLNEEKEYKSLYSWYLQEFKDNKAVGNKFIPWPWTLHFDASELKIVKRIEIENGEDTKSYSSEYIQAKIIPEGYDCLAGSSSTRYSMFGSERIIKEFSLTIRQIKNDSEPEKCTCWGIVSYSGEIDFRDYTTDDVVGFEVWLNSKNFNDIRQFGFNKFDDDTLKLSVKGSGFYSEWSPAISTAHIKVLTEKSEQEIIEEAKGIDAPRLGSIWEFSLFITRSNVLTKYIAAEEILDSALDEDESSATPKRNQDNDLLAHLINTQTSIRKLYLPVWIITILLLLILLK